MFGLSAQSLVRERHRCCVRAFRTPYIFVSGVAAVALAARSRCCRSPEASYRGRHRKTVSLEHSLHEDVSQKLVTKPLDNDLYHLFSNVNNFLLGFEGGSLRHKH